MKNKKWYPILYMFVCTFVLSSILIGFARYTEDRVKANQKLAFEKALLQAVGVELPESRLEIHQLYVDNVKQMESKALNAYEYVKDDSIVAYALPIEGQGFWAPIKAVVGIKSDKKSLMGLAIYEQKETPGLGAEITKPEFKNQFSENNDKVISLSGEAFNIKSPGSELDSSSVYAVTGATQTSTRLEKIINDALVAWRNEMIEKEN